MGYPLGPSGLRTLIDDCGKLIQLKFGGVDWRRRDVRDALVLAVLSLAVYGISLWADLFDVLHKFITEYEEYEVDELLMVPIVLTGAILIFSLRRQQDLSREIEARRRAEAEAQNLARHDPLTGLPNRRYFVERLSEILANTTEASRSAVLMLDLDGFKAINDGYGHAVGDQALAVFSERISAIMRSGAILTRVGGDEFAVIVPNIGSLDDTTTLARRITAAVAEPLLIDRISTTVGVGIGIAIAPGDGMDPEILVQHADRALYQAKADGRSSIRFFEASMNAHVARRLEIERELRTAVADKLIVPFYQPLIALEGTRVIGFEALARWKSDVLGWVPPDVFIAVAEEIGLIGKLGDQLLRQACVDACSWPSETTLAFNISAVQLRDPALGLRILSILGETGLDSRRLELEITETALVDNIAVAQGVIKQLREVGVRVALDDFGTGYATLSQLLSLQLDRIKIDRSFVNGLGKDKERATIVRAILGLASGFGLATTAEGIENADQLAALKADGCQEGQGYLFGKAVPANEIWSLIKKIEPKARVVA